MNSPSSIDIITTRIPHENGEERTNNNDIDTVIDFQKKKKNDLRKAPLPTKQQQRRQKQQQQKESSSSSSSSWMIKTLITIPIIAILISTTHPLFWKRVLLSSLYYMGNSRTLSIMKGQRQPRPSSPVIHNETNTDATSLLVEKTIATKKIFLMDDTMDDSVAPTKNSETKKHNKTIQDNFFPKEKEIEINNNYPDKQKTTSMVTTTTKRNNERIVVVGGGTCPPQNHLEKKNNTAAAAFSYYARNPNELLPLEFVHIRKTGGTAIEEAARKVGVLWGRRSFNGKKIRVRRVNKLAWNNRTKVGNLWHVPPKYLEPYPYNKYYDDNHSNNTISLFAVIRDPYDRAVSEYFQAHKRKKKKRPNARVNDPDYMNDFIQRKLFNKKGDGYIPQHEYVFDNTGRKRLIRHVLRFETLATEFKTLMECYGLGDYIRFPPYVVNKRQKNTKLSRNDLSLDTIAMINQAMHDDFVKFGFPMMNASSLSFVKNTTTEENNELHDIQL